MENLTQITLTNKERQLLAYMTHIAASFISKVCNDESFNNFDVKIIENVMSRSEEVGALVIKLNLDLFTKE